MSNYNLTHVRGLYDYSFLYSKKFNRFRSPSPPKSPKKPKQQNNEFIPEKIQESEQYSSENSDYNYYTYSESYNSSIIYSSDEERSNGYKIRANFLVKRRYFYTWFSRACIQCASQARRTKIQENTNYIFPEFSSLNWQSTEIEPTRDIESRLKYGRSFLGIRPVSFLENYK